LLAWGLLSILYLKNLYKTNMNDKIITALLAILIALSGWSLTTTVGLKSDVAVLKEKVSGIENEIQNSKNFKGKKKRKKKIQTTEKGVQILIIGLILALVLLLGCENVRQSIGVSTSPFSTKMEEKTKLNYKIIFGKVRPKEDDD